LTSAPCCLPNIIIISAIESHQSLVNLSLTKEFLRAFATRCGMNLHVNVFYGENDHHVMEAIFKALGRSLDDASTGDSRIAGILSTKGSL